MGLFSNPLKKLKKIKKIANKLSPIGSKIVDKISPSAKFLSNNKKGRLYPDQGALMREAPREDAPARDDSGRRRVNEAER